MPYWRTSVPAEFDIAKLRPSTLPKGIRFESKPDAKALSVRREEALRRGGKPRDNDWATRLSDCREHDVSCELPCCPLCGGYYRRWFIGELLKLAQQDDLKVVTVYLREVAAGRLKNVDIAQLHAMLRARLRRCGFGGSAMVGGTEARYCAHDSSWLVHVHLLVVDAPAGAIEALKRTFDSAAVKYPVVSQDLIDPVVQLSYIQKFATYHRPGEQRSMTRPRAYPLPPQPHLELLRWMARYRLDDFRFLYGARRRGGRLVRES